MKRQSQKEVNTWNLELIYSTINEMYLDQKTLEEYLEFLLKEQKSFLQTENMFANYMKNYFEFYKIASKLSTYASHKLDQDLKEHENLELISKLEMQLNKFQGKLSFIGPLLIKNKEQINKLLKDSVNQEYANFFKNLFRNEKYILNESEEEIIAKTEPMQGLPYKVYSTLVDSEMDFGEIEVDGKVQRLSSSNYGTILTSNDRKTRKEAFSKTYHQFEKYNQTLVNLYVGQIQGADFLVKVRKYKNSLQKSLHEDALNIEIYKTLIDSITKNISVNHDYMKIRKDLLNYNKLHLYDLYVPLIVEKKKEISAKKAEAITRKVLSILGIEYQEVVSEIFEQRWIDWYPNDNKRSGAYSGGTYQTPAYILLNYDNQLNDLYTLVHEIGHSVHTIFSDRNNSFQDSKYKIFVAEIASTVNELLLTYHLLEKSIDNHERMYYLNYLLEQFRTTVFRQTMFAEFELLTHEKLENEEAVTSKELNKLYLNLNHKYFGANVEVDQEIQYEWGRIPHFYYDFYVYQYATSFCIAIIISEGIYQKDDECKENYLQFLKTGNSKTPLETLKILNIDLSTSDVFDRAMKKYQEVLIEFEELSKNEF